MMRGVKAVLFDLDETLIDASDGLKSHRAVANRIYRYLKGTGTKVKEGEIYSKLVELDDRMNFKRNYNRNSWWPLLLERLGVPLPLPPQMPDELTLLYWDTFAQSTRPYPDAEPTLDYLKRKGYRLGLVTDTDGTKGIKKRRLARIGLIKLFDVVIISGEDTAATKPDPEPFLLAARKLGVRPSECVVVGDKPFTDIKGGNAAGMRTIFVERRDWGVEERPDFKIASLSEIAEIL
jgi:putative hydrolase of the HAD superfamily